MEKITCRFSGKLFASLLSLAAVPACGSGDADVSAHPEITSRATQALSANTNFLEINGSYGAGCLKYSGSWSLPLVGLLHPTNPQTLSVVKDNAECVLTLDSVRLGNDEPSSILYQTADGIALGATYRSSASPFIINTGDPVSFYANGRIEPDITFSSNFTLRVLYSDDPTAASASSNAQYATQSAVATSNDVPAPNYTATTSMNILVDANNIEQSASGTVDLALPSMNPQSGESFVVTAANLGTSPAYADIDAAYQAGTPSTLSQSSPSVDASQMLLDGVDLSSPVERRIIIVHISNGSPSYEVITVTFNHP